jgi:hypothetical protein
VGDILPALTSLTPAITVIRQRYPMLVQINHLVRRPLT